jgi:hypothetical protein
MVSHKAAVPLVPTVLLPGCWRTDRPAVDSAARPAIPIRPGRSRGRWAERTQQMQPHQQRWRRQSANRAGGSWPRPPLTVGALCPSPRHRSSNGHDRRVLVSVVASSPALCKATLDNAIDFHTIHVAAKTLSEAGPVRVVPNPLAVLAPPRFEPTSRPSRMFCDQTRFRSRRQRTCSPGKIPDRNRNSIRNQRAAHTRNRPDPPQILRQRWIICGEFYFHSLQSAHAK